MKVMSVGFSMMIMTTMMMTTIMMTKMMMTTTMMTTRMMMTSMILRLVTWSGSSKLGDKGGRQPNYVTGGGRRASTSSSSFPR